MASTSNKNSPGNYYHEQQSHKHHGEYTTYTNSGSGMAYTNNLAGDGLLSGKNARSSLCSNYNDIESQLFGIGSTNLVTPYKQVTPQFINVQSLHIFQKQQVQLPEPLIIEKNQRPMFMN